MKKFSLVFSLLVCTVTMQAQDYRLKLTLEGHHSGISVLAHSEYTRALIACDEAGYFYVYDPESGAALQQFIGHHKSVRAVAFNSTGKLMLSVASDELKIWNVEEFSLLHQIVKENYSDIRFGLFSIADGFVYFNSGSRLYKTRSDLSQAVLKLYDFTEVITAGVITDDRSALIFATGSLIRVINTRTDNIIQELQVGHSPVEQLALMPGNRLASWSKDGTVTVWNLSLGMMSSSPVVRFKAGTSSPMSFSADGKRMVSGNIGYWARIWDWREREVEQELFGHKANVSASVFAKNDELIYTGSGDKSIRVWSRHEVENPVVKEIAITPPGPIGATLAPDEPKAVLFDEKNIPLLVNGRTVSQTETFETNQEELQIFVYDNLVIDGDTISLNFNGEWLLKNYAVERKKKKINLHFRKGNNSLILYAENLGKSPPNTASVEFQVGGAKKIIRLRSDLKTCSALNFIYK